MHSHDGKRCSLLRTAVVLLWVGERENACRRKRCFRLQTARQRCQRCSDSAVCSRLAKRRGKSTNGARTTALTSTLPQHAVAGLRVAFLYPVDRVKQIHELGQPARLSFELQHLSEKKGLQESSNDHQRKAGQDESDREKQTRVNPNREAHEARAIRAPCQVDKVTVLQTVPMGVKTTKCGLC